MRTRVVLVLALVTLLIVTVMLGITVIPGITVNPANTGKSNPSQLTTSDLAEILGIQWWTFDVPADAQPGDTLSVHWISTTGTESGGTLSISPGDQVKIFYWMDQATHSRLIKLAGKSDSSLTASEYPPDELCGMECGTGNGGLAKPGDLLLKMKKKGPGQDSIESSNTLKAGEIGLKVEIERKPVAVR
jgi:hypothetical protein